MVYTGRKYWAAHLRAVLHHCALKKCDPGLPLVVQWLGLCAPKAGGPGFHLARQGTITWLSSHATTKDPACHNRPGAAKLRKRM